MRDFIELVSQGIRLAANLTKMGKDAAVAALRSYFALVKRCTIKALAWSGAAFIALLVMMAMNVPPGILHVASIIIILAALAGWLLVLYPVFLVRSAWRRQLPGIYEILVEPFQLYRSVLAFVGAALVTLIAVPFWKEPDMLWLGMAILFSALLLPTSALSTKLRNFLPSLQVLQILLMVFLLVLRYGYPEQTRMAGQRLKSVFGRTVTGWAQEDVTQQWHSIRDWFDDGGKPLVWYSGNDAEGYRLWKASGYDRYTGEKLKQLDTQALKKHIVEWLKDHVPAPRQSNQAGDQPRLVGEAHVGGEAPTGRIQLKGTGRSESPQLVPAPPPRVAHSPPGGELADASPRGPVPIPSASEQWTQFSAAAREIIATDLLGIEEDQFARQFVVRCGSASQSRRQFQGFGVDSDVIVVTVRFRISEAAGSPPGVGLTKVYEVSETILASQFKGLNDPDTVGRVSRSLQQEIKKDIATVAALQKPFKR